MSLAPEVTVGSSPYARGGHKIKNFGSPQAGLIPACAGRACPRISGRTAPRAHPRMRGECQAEAPSKPAIRGSSPHARGGLRCRQGWANEGGLIPACAGRAEAIGAIESYDAAHPRMRGEGGGITCTRPLARGSSPHARGGHARQLGAAGKPGLIPACAGRAAPSTCPPSSTTAHPRMRGEGTLPLIGALEWHGSSPHARGGHVLPPGDIEQPRLIPACAGRAARSCRFRAPTSAHPRMRGEGVPENQA